MRRNESRMRQFEIPEHLLLGKRLGGSNNKD